MDSIVGPRPKVASQAARSRTGCWFSQSPMREVAHAAAELLLAAHHHEQGVAQAQRLEAAANDAELLQTRSSRAVLPFDDRCGRYHLDWWTLSLDGRLTEAECAQISGELNDAITAAPAPGARSTVLPSWSRIVLPGFFVCVLAVIILVIIDLALIAAAIGGVVFLFSLGLACCLYSHQRHAARHTSTFAQALAWVNRENGLLRRARMRARPLVGARQRIRDLELVFYAVDANSTRAPPSSSTAPSAPLALPPDAHEQQLASHAEAEAVAMPLLPPPYEEEQDAGLETGFR